MNLLTKKRDSVPVQKSRLRYGSSWETLPKSASERLERCLLLPITGGFCLSDKEDVADEVEAKSKR